MATCLRSSTGNLARLSRRSLESASRSRLASPTSSLAAPRLRPVTHVRFYSSKKDPKDEKSDGEKSGNKETNKPGKAAPGFEHMYDKDSPISKPAESSKSTPDAEVSKFSVEDEQTIKEISNIIKRGMSAQEKELFDKSLEAMRKEGMPDELKAVLHVYRGDKNLDLSAAARVVRITGTFMRKVRETSAQARTRQQEEEEEHDNKEEPEQKAGAHDPGPKEQKSKKQGGSKGTGQEWSTLNFNFKWDTGTFITSAFVTYLLYRSIMPGENSKDITWQEFKTQFMDRGLVEKLTVVNRQQVRVHLNREAVRSAYPDSPAGHGNFHYYFSIGDVGTFERHLDEAQDSLAIPGNQRIPVSYDETTPWTGAFLSFAPTLLLIGGTYWLLRRSAGSSGGNSGIFGVGKSRAKKFNHETDVKVSFKDVAGMDEAKQEIMEFVSFLKEPGMYQKLGAKIPRGAILSGPPGTGKTLLAKATAGESSVPFFSVSGSEFVEMFVGVGASRVRDLFQNARKTTPCIIFIDEIDAIGKSRGKNVMSGGNDEREATLNQILTEMDGFNTSEQVVVLAGTNRADVLDKALMRPGRFDRHIHIDKPTMEGRKQIFAVHLKNIVTNEEPEHLHGRLAALTPGFAGADIANCVNEAALIAARYAAESVTMKHFEAAIERVIGGLERKSLVLGPEEKRVVAYHEAGHAICGWFFKYADPLLKVSIIPRGQGALGYAQYLPDSESYLMNVNQLMDRMAMTLGGRVSEELNFETVTSGASDDFNKVTRMATAMVTKWGMSNKVGYLYFEDDPSQQLHKPFSEETAKSIDSEVRRIVDEAYKQCRELLSEKKKEVTLVAEELLKKEALTRDDLVRILGKRPFEDNRDFTKYFGSKGDREGVPGSVPDHTPGEPLGAGPLGLGGGVGPTPTIFKNTGPQ